MEQIARKLARRLVLRERRIKSYEVELKTLQAGCIALHPSVRSLTDSPVRDFRVVDHRRGCFVNGRITIAIKFIFTLFSTFAPSIIHLPIAFCSGLVVTSLSAGVP